MASNLEIGLNGEGWRVMKDPEGSSHYLYPPKGVPTADGLSYRTAERACILQAYAGNADAITALMLCDDDAGLQRMLAGMQTIPVSEW
jgi:hypothetical protein